MAKYSATGLQTPVSTSLKTMMNIFVVTGSLVRYKLYDFSFGTTGAPADNVMQYVLRRSTTGATGEGTGVVPTALDPADAVTLLDSGEDYSAEPAYTAATELFDLGVNQRASYRWVANPNGELIVPATADAGLGLATLSPAYTGAANCTLHVEQQ